jgi:thioredoxin reductase (NADPH)
VNIDVDCLIIGGGPAGLTGAVYLGRFRRRALVIDAGGGRASLISKSHNFPGATHGISGPALLENLGKQARNYGVQIMTGRVGCILRDGGGFVAEGEGFSVRAAKILLATGVIDNSPPLAQARKFIYEGGIRFCPVCDGYEYIGKTIGVLGPPNLAIPKSRFLRTYSDKVYLIPTEELSQDEKYELNRYQIREAGIALDVKPSGDKVIIDTRHESMGVDVLYPAFGFAVNSDLATKLGAEVDDDGFLKVNIHQMTTVEGLYAAGDVVMDLSQISVATGHAAIAATHIHKQLPNNFL